MIAKTKQFFEKWLKHFGFLSDKMNFPTPIDVTDYKDVKKDMAEVHREFIEGLNEEEKRRLDSIENKSSTLVSQTGIIFSLIGLFIPLFIDKLSSTGPFFKIPFVIVLVIAFLFYTLTIRNASRNFNIRNFYYQKLAPTTVITQANKTKDEFNVSLVKDLLKSYKRNVYLNNVKADNLIYSYRSFQIANTLTGTLVLMICISLFSIDSGKKTITLEDPVIINNYAQFSKHIEKKKISITKKLNEPKQKLKVFCH